MGQPVQKRAPLIDQAYFDRMVQFDTETIASSEARLAQPSKGTPASRANYAYSIFRKRFQSLILRYSRGDVVRLIASSGETRHQIRTRVI
jgi:hypothetical protein